MLWSNDWYVKVLLNMLRMIIIIQIPYRDNNLVLNATFHEEERKLLAGESFKQMIKLFQK